MMPPADNTRFLLEATQQRSKQARQRAEDAITAAGREHQPVSMVAIARAAATSRSWLYTQPDLVAAIKTLQQRRPSPARTGPQPASEASLLRRLDAAHERRGGLPAARSDALKIEVDGSTVPLSLVGSVVLADGERIVSVHSGGGYDPPQRRDPVLVEHDLREGLISPRRARAVYGFDGPDLVQDEVMEDDYRIETVTVRA